MTSPPNYVSTNVIPTRLSNTVFCIVCVGLSLWSVRAVLNHPTSVIPTTTAGSETVPLFNVWTMVWNARQFQTGFSQYWDAPIFFPQTGSFAFSEPQPATLLMSPFILVFGSPALAANVWLILSLTFNGVFASRLLRCLNVSLIAGYVTGAAIVLLPMVHDQLDVLQLVPLWPTLWTWTALIRLRQEAMLRPATQALSSVILCRSIELGVAVFFTAICSIHHFLFLSLLLACTGWILIPLRLWRRWFPGVLLALSVAVVLLLPILLPMSTRLRGSQFERSDTAITRLSARSDDLLKVSPGAIIRLPWVTQRGAWFLCPGWLRLAVAVIAIGRLWQRPSTSNRRAVAFLAALAGCAAFWSMGTHLQLLGWKPWTTLTAFVPGFAAIRSVFRFGYFFQLALLLLSGIGLDQVIRRLGNLRGPVGLRLSSGVVLCGLIIFEVLPEDVRQVPVPVADEHLPWLSFLKTHRSGNGGVLLLPYPKSSAVDQYATTTRWMIQCTLHGIPIANGYSGFFPESHFRRQQQLASSTFAPATLKNLQNDGIEFLVVFPEAPQFRMQELLAARGSLSPLKLAWEAPNGPRIFQLQPR